MLKFLRKYNKIILAVFGSLLMVVFLLPEAINQIGGDPGSRTEATLNGKAYSARDMSEVARELQIITSIDPRLQTLLAVQDVEHWLLLREAAERGGFVGGPQDGRNFLVDAAEALTQLQFQNLLRQAPQLAEQLTPDLMRQSQQALLTQLDTNRAQAVGTTASSELEVNRALARARGVLRMYSAYLGAAHLSRPESVDLARRYFDEVKVDFVLIPAATVEAEVDEPTEEQIAAHFEQYKNVRRGEGDYGFGYLRPPVVKLEWLTINYDSIGGQVKVDPVEVATRYRRGEDTTYSGLELSEVRDQIAAQIRAEQVNRIADEAQRKVRAEFLKASANLPTDGRRKILPDDWDSQRRNYDEVAETVNADLQQRYGFENPVINVFRSNAWIDASALRAASSIGASFLNFGGRQIGFTELAFSVPPFTEQSPHGIQVGVTSDKTTTDGSRNIFFFRINEARAESPPDDVGEVRGRVVADLKRLSAFDRLKEQGDFYKSLVAGGSLQDVAEDANTNVVAGVGVRRDGMQTADGRPVAADVNTESVRTAIIDRGEELDPRVDLNLAAPELRTVAVAVPEALSLGLFYITSLEPISIEIYRRLEPSIRPDYEALGNPYYMLSGLDSPFSPERLAQRLNYERITTGSSDEEEVPLDLEETAAEPPAEAPIEG